MAATNTAESGTTSGLMDHVRNTATSQLTSQKSRMTDGLSSVAQAVRQSTESLRNNQQTAVAQYLDKAADQIERVSTHLRDRDVRDLLDDAQHFARRRPAVFIAAAFALGVLTARFAKSSRNTSEAGRPIRGATSYAPAGGR